MSYEEDFTARGTLNAAAVLNEEAVLEIRAAYAARFTKRVSMHMLARKYGVSVPTISDILHRETWKHI